MYSGADGQGCTSVTCQRFCSSAKWEVASLIVYSGADGQGCTTGHPQEMRFRAIASV